MFLNEDIRAGRLLMNFGGRFSHNDDAPLMTLPCFRQHSEDVTINEQCMRER